MAVCRLGMAAYGLPKSVTSDAALVERRRLQRVDEALVEQQPRRRRRVEDVAGQREHERREERVAQQRVGVVPADVDPEHEAERDRELALEVGELRHLHDEAGRVERPVAAPRAPGRCRATARRARRRARAAAPSPCRRSRPCATARRRCRTARRSPSWRASPPQPSGRYAPIVRTGQSRTFDTARMLASRRRGPRGAARTALALLGVGVAARDGRRLGLGRRVALHGGERAGADRRGLELLVRARPRGSPPRTRRSPPRPRRARRSRPRAAPPARSAARVRACRARARRRSACAARSGARAAAKSGEPS